MVRCPRLRWKYERVSFRVRLVRICVLLGALPNFTHVLAADCSSGSIMRQQPGVALEQGFVREKGAPFFVGFNLEAFPFSLAHLSQTDGSVHLQVRDKVAALDNVVLRYPGGTIADRIDVIDTLGPLRKQQKLANWAEPQTLKFGLQEYLDFVSITAARPWLVVNVIDADHNGDPAELASRNAKAISFLSRKAPPSFVELGNEPYNLKYEMEGRDYAKRFMPTLRMLRDEYPEVKPVVAAMGFNRNHVRARDFNKEVVEAVGSADVDFALHYYYDGHPGGPPLPIVLQNLCSTLMDLERYSGRSPTVWITEHGRWPGGRVGDTGWNQLWPNTYNFGAALSVAEFIIETAKIGPVHGVFMHGLGSSTGPWAMLHPGAEDGRFLPSAPMLAQTMLYPMSLGRVRTTVAYGPRVKGRDQFRAVFYEELAGSLSVALVNRGTKSEMLEVRIPEKSNRNLRYSVSALVADGEDAYVSRSTENAVRVVNLDGDVKLDETGKGFVPVPAMTVAVYRFTE